jgi:hypothetical protein
LLIEQIREPRDEAILRNSIPALTPIDNAVSLAVKAQYEENPFPRWVKTPADLVGYSVADAMRILFPTIAVRPSAGDQGCDILVAGCGTGRHSIEAAQRFKRARACRRSQPCQPKLRQTQDA